MTDRLYDDIHHLISWILPYLPQTLSTLSGYLESYPPLNGTKWNKTWSYFWHKQWHVRHMYPLCWHQHRHLLLFIVLIEQQNIVTHAFCLSDGQTILCYFVFLVLCFSHLAQITGLNDKMTISRETLCFIQTLCKCVSITDLFDYISDP